MTNTTKQFDKQVDAFYLPFFYSAFHPYQTVGIITIGLGFIGYISSASSAILLSTFGLFFISPIIWIVSVFFVNSNYSEIVEAFRDDAAQKATEIFAGAGDRPQTFHIEHSYDSVNFVRPNRVHEPITLIAGEGSLLIYDDAHLSLDFLRAELGNSTREMYYDSVTSVNYDSPFFEVRLSDGDHAKYRSSRKPDDVLHELQQRVRQFKTA